MSEKQGGAVTGVALAAVVAGGAALKVEDKVARVAVAGQTVGIGERSAGMSAGSFAKAGARIEGRALTRLELEEAARAMPPPPIRPVVIPQMLLNRTVNSADNLHIAVDVITRSAGKNISSDAMWYGSLLTEKRAIDIVNKQLAASAQKVAAAAPNQIKFEVFTGKLNVASSKDLGFIEIKGGEVNIYAIGSIAGGMIYTCSKVSMYVSDECLQTAFKKAAEATGLKSPTTPSGDAKKT